MKKPYPFVPLHIHSQYSLLGSIIDIEALVDTASSMGFPAIALTDRASLAGVIEFYVKAGRKGLNPIIGYECPVSNLLEQHSPAEEKHPTCHIVLLAENNTGYLNLCRINRKVHNPAENRAGGIAITNLCRYKEGIIALSGGACGGIDWLIRNDCLSSARLLSRRLLEIFGPDHFFLELQRDSGPLQAVVDQEIHRIAQDLSIGLVATSECRYLNPGDASLFSAFCAMSKKGNQPGIAARGRHLAGRNEMAHLFADIPVAMQNTLRIARRCKVDLRLDVYRYPDICCKNVKRRQKLDTEAKTGLRRYAAQQNETWPLAKWKKYLWRLYKEIATIKRLQLEGFFLMAADLIRHAEVNRIPVGPGRGSLCASLVAHCLGITNVDPLKYGLFFEQYINASHRRCPGMQLDISKKHLGALRRYFFNTYGAEGKIVAASRFKNAHPQILAKKMVHWLGIDNDLIDCILKSLPDYAYSAGDIVSKIEVTAFPASKQTRVLEFIHAYRMLSHLPVSSWQHKTGLVVANVCLADFVPVIDGPGKIPRCQLSSASLQESGLARIYLIPMPALDMIAAVVEAIRKTRPDFRIEKIPEADSATFALICSQKTDGIFLMQSSGMKKLTAAIGVKNLSELAAMIALFRPAALKRGLAEKLFLYKNPKILKFESLEIVRKTLSETWGVLLYREQVLAICNQVAGYSFEEADRLTMALEKQNAAIIQKERKNFVNRAKAQHIVDEENAFCLFERFEGAAPRLYIKAHALSYAKTIYRMAYLKTHFPEAFDAELQKKGRSAVKCR